MEIPDLILPLLLLVALVFLLIVFGQWRRGQRSLLVSGRKHFARRRNLTLRKGRTRFDELPNRHGLEFFSRVFSLAPMGDLFTPSCVMTRSDPELWIFDLSSSSDNGDQRWTAAYVRSPQLDLPRFWTSWDPGRTVPSLLRALMPIETQPAVAELRKRDGEALYLHGDLPILVRELASRPAVQDLLGRCEFYIHGCGDRLMAFQYERASVSQLERLLTIADELPTSFCQSS